MSSVGLSQPSFEHRAEKELPEGWAYAPLGILGRWGTGNTPSKANERFWINGQIPWVSPKDMKVAYLSDAIDHVTDAAVASGGAAIVPPGTIFFVVRGMILAHTFPVAIVTKSAAFNQDMRSLQPVEGISGPYLLRALQQEAPYILGVVREATHGTLRLESDTLQPWPIPIAPLPEQHRIVEKVEALLEQVNRAKARLERVPLILKRFRQAVLAAACSGELTREWREDRGIVVQWDNLALSQLIVNGPQNGLYKPQTAYGQGIGIVRIDDFHEGRLLRPWAELRKLSVTHAELKTYGLRNGDLLINRVNSPKFVGKPLLVDDLHEPAIFESNMMRLTLDQHRIDPGFAILVLLSPQGKEALQSNAKHAVNQSSINQGDVGAVRVPLPGRDEQRAIREQVAWLFALADTIERRVQAATARANKLPQAILSKAFSGELVPTEAELARLEGRTYETAEELLKRVTALGSDAPSARKGRGRRTG